MQAMTAIRPIVRVASAVAPDPVACAAFWWWCRTRPPTAGPPSVRAAVARADARLAEVATRRTIVPVRCGGLTGTVVCHICEPAADVAVRGTIAVAHGWTGRAAFMTAFVGPLTKAGFRVVALDLPGHGAAGGRSLHVPLGVASLAAAHAATGPWHGIIGHSFGGLIAMVAAAGVVVGVPAIPVERLVLVAAPDGARLLFDMLGQGVGLGPRGQAALDAMVLEVAGRPIGDFEAAPMLRTIDAQVLVLHAPDDREVPYACAEAVAAAAPDKVTLQPVPGAGHRRILGAPAAVIAATRFLVLPAREGHPARSA